MPKASDDAPASRPVAASAASPAPAPASTALELTPLEETQEFVKALYFGTEGTGKTTASAFMANLPGDGVVVVINAEAGLKKGPLKTLGVDTTKLVIWNPPGDGVMTYEKLEQLYFQLSAKLREDPESIKGVVLDSLTEIVNKILEQASYTMWEREQRNTRKAEEDKRLTPEVTQLEDYGLMTSQVRKLMRKFRDLPCHFAATALETEAAGEGEFSHSKKQAAPEMTPKLRTSVLGYVDIAVRLTAESLPMSATDSETLVTGRTKPSALVRGKDRFGILPRDLPEPRFDRIAEYVNGDTTATMDPLFGMYAEARERSEKYREEKRAAKS